MQIFLDESGGPGQSHFVMTAVRLSAKSAERVVKTIRKALKILKNEIHARDLTDVQLIKALDVLASPYDGLAAISVICGRTEPLEAWALGALSDSQLWQGLVVESCLPLMTPDIRSIHPDAGRYKASVMAELEKGIGADLARRARLPVPNVQCRESQSGDHPGLFRSKRPLPMKPLEMVKAPQRNSLRGLRWMCRRTDGVPVVVPDGTGDPVPP